MPSFEVSKLSFVKAQLYGLDFANATFYLSSFKLLLLFTSTVLIYFLHPLLSTLLQVAVAISNNTLLKQISGLLFTPLLRSKPESTAPDADGSTTSPSEQLRRFLKSKVMIFCNTFKHFYIIKDWQRLSFWNQFGLQCSIVA